jgi:uncharacterized protein YkwD
MRKLAPLLSILALVGATALASAPASAGSRLDATRLALRQQLLEMINNDRGRVGLAPVDLDLQVSALGDTYCESQIRNQTVGHFTVDGLAPYMRYSFAGGNDGLTENTAAWSASYTFSENALLELIRQSEAAMMAEVPPHDGHRLAILDPAATHVGIGLAWEQGEFRLTEEFIRRYVEWTRPLPRAARVGDRVLFGGRPPAGYRIEAIAVHREPLPQPMPPEQVNEITGYSLPDLRREYLPRLPLRRWVDPDGSLHELREQYSDGRTGDFQTALDGSFAFAVPLLDGPGIYTVVVWIHKDGALKGVSASNVSIRVELPPKRGVGPRAGR